MLDILLPETETEPPVMIHLEHSLSSLSKWESIHEKAFYKQESMSPEETVSYIQQMLVGEPPSIDWLNRLEPDHFSQVTAYINSRQTATWFRENPNERKSSEVVTSELIYYWMIGFQIPFSCDQWHLNRLMTLIKICGVKQTKPKKMSRQEQAAEMRRLNAERRAQLGTTG